MKGNVTRRSFLAASAATAGMAGLVGCSTEEESPGNDTHDVTAAPAADAYPIEPEEFGSGTVRYSSEETVDGWTHIAQEDGVTLGIMDTDKLIQVDGFAFKDLNGNGKLDLWEDWRQTPESRAEALAAELTADEALALMIHGSIFNADDLDTINNNGGYVNGVDANPTTAEIFDSGIRTLLQFSDSQASGVLARWTNSLQEYVEGKTYGIPVNISNNPKTYGFPGVLGLAATFDPDLVREVAQEQAKAYRIEGVTTILGTQMDLATEPRWRRITGTFGEDPALARDMTNSFTSGIQSTYDDDGNDLGWGTDSVISMLKHFPSDGSGESGRESHNFYGKYAVYPGNGFSACIVPFVDGGLHLDSATGQAAAFMDSYSIAWSDTEEYGELVGSAFSSWKNTTLLREMLDYDGLICTDWGVIYDSGNSLGHPATPWGMEDVTWEERYVKVIEAGVDQIGGSCDILTLQSAYKQYENEVGEEAALERVRESARRLLWTEYLVGLPDCPYVESRNASTVVDALADFAQEVVDKSIVMLKNSGGIIAQATGQTPTVYIPMRSDSGGLPVTESAALGLFNIVTDTLGDPTGDSETYVDDDITRAGSDAVADCDFAVVFINNPAASMGYDTETSTYVPISLQYGEYVADGPNVRETSLAGDLLDNGTRENRSYYGQSTVASNLSDLELVQSVREVMGEKPVVVCIDADRPMVFSELEPLADAILMGFDVSYDQFLNILAGQAEPTALLPLQMPSDMETVEAQLEDVPRDMECYVDSEGNEYDFGFGLNWSGVISDERTARYCVEPLTQSEYVHI